MATRDSAQASSPAGSLCSDAESAESTCPLNATQPVLLILLKMLLKIFFEKLYQYNPALNTAAFMLDKDKSEHYAAGSVIIDRAVEGIQPAIQKLQSLTTDQFEQTWQTSAAANGHCVQVGTACQLEVGQLSTHTGAAAAAEYIEYLAAQAAHEEDLQLGGSLNTIAPAPPSSPAASDYQAALLCNAIQLRDSD